MDNQLEHHGILGMHWGIRRTPEQLGHISREDRRFVKKKQKKIMEAARKASDPELRAYQRELMQNPNARNKNGQLSAATINAYNRRMAQLMSEKVSDLRAPSGKTIQFVAKRGQMGVYMALADEGYNMAQLKNGIYGSGRIAYRKTVVDQVRVDDR